ncbi:hypothetical protein [Tenacibaculum sp. 190524A05c]|uniref:hypothetical protein n=1 Tax=Tenacibaculum platacis TaxID=3137852 RepID=UPI0032B28B8E
MENIPLQRRGNDFDWAPTDDGGGGIDSSNPCEGIWIEEYKACNKGGRADGHEPALQHDGITKCNGSDFIGYIIDFSHCTGGTYDPPSGPGHGSRDPGDPTPGGGGGGGSGLSGSSGSDNDNPETFVSTPIDPDEKDKCP